MPNSIPYAKQTFDTEDIQSVTQALNDPIITRGDKVEAFENEIAKYCGAKYAVAFNSGSTALAAVYHAANTGIHDRIISTPNTFVATVAPALARGASPLFIDLDPTTGNLDIDSLFENMPPEPSRGKNIISPVHYSGIAVDMQRIDQCITQENTVIIEDAAHAIGSSYKSGEKVGSCTYSDMTIFSFHPAKTITTGEGGLVTTNRSDFFHKLQLYRNNGMVRDAKLLQREANPWYYEVQEIGGNFNFTDFQAALGSSQLKKLSNFVEKRKELVSLYRKQISPMEHVTMSLESYDDSTAYHLCVLQIDFTAYKKTRKQVMEALKAKNIGTQVHYIPVYHHPFFQEKYGDLSQHFPHTEKFYAQALSIPLFPTLRKDQVQYITQTLKNVLTQ